jgi:hypothetical protein
MEGALPVCAFRVKMTKKGMILSLETANKEGHPMRQWIKKTMLFLLALALAAGFCGCGKKAGVTVNIDCIAAVEATYNRPIFLSDEGWMLRDYQVSLKEGETAHDALRKACEETDMELETTGIGSSEFVTGINALLQYECGEKSTWIFFVNGEGSKTAMNDYIPKAGDVLSWRYSLDWGSDVGAFDKPQEEEELQEEQ